MRDDGRQERDFREGLEIRRREREKAIQGIKNLTFERAKRIWDIISRTKDIFHPEAVILRRENMLDNIEINELMVKPL